jgi:4-amino-4-deoxy-L-arabinose transferase-like glycosyltransferase
MSNFQGVTKFTGRWSWPRGPWLLLLICGIAARIAIVALPGNQLRARWSGGGDAPIYVLLARNILDGRGFGFVLQPTALRAPGYPLLLAGLMWIFGGKFVLAIRWIQFALGIGTACLCARSVASLFGEKAGRATLIITLLFPTLIFVTGEVLTEAVASFLTAVFFYLAVRAFLKPRMRLFAGLGIVVSIAALFRFNMAVLGFVALWVAFAARSSRPAWQRALVVCATAALTISPWVIRNEFVFHGEVLYSTLSGHDAVEGVLAPQGRALPGDEERIRAAEGWILPDIETNVPSRRLGFPSESVLNHSAWVAARRLWAEYGRRLLPLEAAKLSYFWLSTDQVFFTHSFSLRQRILRWGGVFAYWILLGLGIAGWLIIRRTQPALAWCLVSYVAVVTLLHLPFNMLTRLRIPLVDPLLAMLGGVAIGFGLSQPTLERPPADESLRPRLDSKET